MHARLATRTCLLLGVAVLAGCADDTGEAGGTRAPTDPTDGASTIPGEEGEGTAPPGENARVVAVFDGDSMLVDPGSGEVEVRLAGVNAPERDECFGPEAEQWMAGAAGSEVTLVRVGNEDDADQFGRLLRDVWVGDRWLNREAVSEGYAMVIHTGRDGQDELLAATDAAWEDGAGMWGVDVCGAFEEGVVIAELEWDPAGPDDQDPMAEYTVIENHVDESIDISGWVLRDESTQNRYVFREGEVLEPTGTLLVYSGCGDDGGAERYWCAQSPVWSNGGDTALLQTAEGTVVDRIPYP